MGSPPFKLFVLPIKQDKKVAQVKVGWALNENALRAAQDEVSRSKVGRRARLAGTVEHVAERIDSLARLSRRPLF